MDYSNNSEEVKLAIYDLSRGMARSLSSQFLGPMHSIDIIPHTGIVIFGKEYYFGGGPGGGITSSDPSQFRSQRGLEPIQIMTLGHTNISQQAFESWCDSMTKNGTYAAYSYDLIERNCNNFSHDAALKGLKLTKGVPDWILNIPHVFVSSPMGQMIRPMLQQMQITGPSGGSGEGVQRPVSSNNSASYCSNPSSSDYNPWANLGTTTTSTTTTTSATTSNSSQTIPVQAENVETKKSVNDKKTLLETPVLDSYNNTLLSNDTNVVPICINKLKQSKHLENYEISSTLTSSHLELLDKLQIILLRKEKDENATTILSNVSQMLLHLFAVSSMSTERLYSLMLLRLIVMESNLEYQWYQTVLLDVSQFILGKNEDMKHESHNNAQLMIKKNEKHAAALRSMAWCVLSNAMGVKPPASLSPLSTNDKKKYIFNDQTFLQNLVDRAILDISTSSDEKDIKRWLIKETKINQPVEVRQCACALLYNLTLHLTRHSIVHHHHIECDNDNCDVPDIIVAIMCGVSEGLSEDKDSITFLRRLLIVGKIMIVPKEKRKLDDELVKIKRVNHLAGALLADIGYLDKLIALEQQNDLSQNHKVLLGEIIDAVVGPETKSRA